MDKMNGMRGGRWPPKSNVYRSDDLKRNCFAMDISMAIYVFVQSVAWPWLPLERKQNIGTDINNRTSDQSVELMAFSLLFIICFRFAVMHCGWGAHTHRHH